MLFHLILTHTPDNCPGYLPPEKLAKLYEGSDKILEAAKKLNVKIHFLLQGAPEHVIYALLEADSIFAVNSFISGFPVRQDAKVTPVLHFQDFLSASKAQLAQR